MNAFSLVTFIFSLLSVGSPMQDGSYDAKKDVMDNYPNVCVEETAEQQKTPEETQTI